MRRELLLPKLGLTMTEGTLVEWLVRPGERFRADQSLFVIESEKAAIEVPAEADGLLLEASVAPGATLAIGTVIGFWDDDSNVAAPAPAPAIPALPAIPAIPATAPPELAVPARIVATPLARRLARERGVDLATVSGSGPRGRIRQADLPTALPLPAAGTASLQTPASGQLRPPTSTEQAVARKLVAAKQDIPHFYLALEAEVSALQQLRADLNASQSERRFTLNHFIVAAVGRALAQMPEVNRVWTADGILALPASDVGIAVHTDRGLMVPVLRGAGGLALSQLAAAATDAAARAQAGRLSAGEMAGGAITVSNAGMHDVTYMTSIINPGQAMILGVGSVRGVFRPGADDQPVLRRELGMVLSADHRVLDGVTALQFLKRIVTLLERPPALLVT